MDVVQASTSTRPGSMAGPQRNPNPPEVVHRFTENDGNGTLAAHGDRYSFDCRTDAGGKDPDVSSPTLRQYHKLLWSKLLPNGRRFDLNDTLRGVYLHHRSELGEYFLSTDSVIPSQGGDSRRRIRSSTPRRRTKRSWPISYTIGGMTVFTGEPNSGQVDQPSPRMKNISDVRGLLPAAGSRH